MIYFKGFGNAKNNEFLMLDELKRIANEIIFLWLVNKKDFPRINPVVKDMQNKYIFSAYKFVIINNTFIESYDITQYSLVFSSLDEFGNSIKVDFKKIETINYDRFIKYVRLLSSFIELLRKNHEIKLKNAQLKIINMSYKKIRNEKQLNAIFTTIDEFTSDIKKEGGGRC